MSDGRVQLSIEGRGAAADHIPYEVEHVAQDDGETHIVRVRFTLLGMQASVDFLLDEAEEFLISFRDELVRAKRARLEWETDTDPETGIGGEESG